MKYRYLSAIVAVAMSTGAWSSGALAAEPKALVMDIVGDTQPVVDAFDELDAGTTIALQGDAELSVTFYPTCEDVTVRGGSITISDTQMTISSGTIIDSASGECPGNVQLAPSDVINAAIITRASRPLPEVSLRPTVAVVGADADGYREMSVHTKKGVVLIVPMSGRSAEWPAGAAPLKVGGEYLVVVKGSGVQMRVAKVIAVQDAPRVTVLRQ